MKFVLDACVAVSALRPREPYFEITRPRIKRVLTARDAPTVPAIFEAEVIASLTKHEVTYRTRRPTSTRCYRSAPSRRYGKLAAETGLKAADAIYAQLAVRLDTKLLTVDEQLLRLTPDGRAQRP
ncbi:MAG: PIN domain-containing protein [Labilithrix sp.]|nr:PIN domain-containing protein [Labilithrix sp.]MCW5818013.1 PIN domain-containing protein [Labilithrix sp.]